MSQVTPSKVFTEVSAAVPAACRENIVIIGSLAAGYHFFGDDESKAVRTKDVDLPENRNWSWRSFACSM